MKRKKSRKESKQKFNLLIIVFVPLIIILLGFRIIVYNQSFYEKEFQKNNVYETFPEQTVDIEVGNLFNYLINDKKLDTTFFNEKEKSHLKDVKDMIDSAINLLLILILLFFILLIYFYNTKQLIIFFNSLMLGSFLSIFLILIIFLLSLSNFDDLFLNFHLISFNNDLWLLNPETDNLIRLFPQQFFYDALSRIVIYSLLISVLVLIFSFYIRNRLKYNNT